MWDKEETQKVRTGKRFDGLYESVNKKTRSILIDINVNKSYIDITGTRQTVSSGTSAGLIPTGQTIPLCNIYDMGGNVWEWTTESCSYNYAPYTARGGGYNDEYIYRSAGRRQYAINTDDDLGFRITLFL